ncbi:osmotically-inducible protein OsmY [Panacagrimonas perspica]|uniref:Osmotically-inducible protein OsmY n=1 Tax=Panacagrimonas perspica TaxID=381431 RepID=A0A4R7PD56_9GAMM|nr:BON domain-containing protein [Panacagrimonas perspica]TDU31662.1 osmotically-inducible protein OsmY [Panacagrimonas perspica]THD03341.1 hypothetical protein B1810_11040 [Panacagrimonas perspica]
MNDLQLKQAVMDELEFDPAIDAAHVTAFVHDGVVTLAGYVGDYTQKHAAETAARRIKGVRAIAQEIEVRLPTDRKIADDEIADRATRILDWDLRLPRDAIQVMVEKGVVVLRGTVAWEFLRREAEADVRKLGGVLGVSNHICVVSPARLGSVQKKIHAAFERSAELQAEKVTVHFDEEGIVKLGGQLHSMLERAAAENAAWSAPGVSKVINQIEIGY